MVKLYEKLDKFYDSLEGKLTQLALGTIITTGIASDLPRALSTNNYKLIAFEIASATYFGVRTYFEGKKIAKEYKK